MRSPFLRGIYIRLLALGAIASLGAVLSFGFYIAREQTELATQARQREVRLLAEGVARAAAHHVLSRDYWSIEQILRQTLASPHLTGIQVTDLEGRLLGNVRRSPVTGEASLSFELQALSPPDLAQNPGIQQAVKETWALIEFDGPIGWVRVEPHLDIDPVISSHIWRDSLVMALLTVFISGLVLAWLLKRLIKGLQEATDFASNLPLNHGQTLGIHSTITEVDALVAALNKTSRQLFDQDQALEISRAQQALRNRIYERLALGGDIHEVLELIVGTIEVECGQCKASILMLSPDGRHLLHGAAPSLPDFYNQAVHGLEIGEGVGSCGTAAHRGERVIVEDISTHPFWAPYRELTARAGLAACWSEPIRSSRGEILGTCAIYHSAPTSPSPEQIDYIHQSANLASVALERHHSEEELQLAASLYHASGEAIIVSDGENRILAVNPAFTQLTGYTQSEVIGRSPSILNSGRMDKSFYKGMWEALRTAGRWQGEIWNRRKNGEIYAEWLTINVIRDAQERPFRYIALFSDITAKKQAEETIWQQANYDQLTGLPNRRLFRDRLRQDLQRAERQQNNLALMFVDLDRFKEINEAHGHDAGDRLLIESAQRIASCVRASDTIARLGSDEFAITLANLHEPSEAERIAQSILQALSEPFLVKEETSYISASIGVTLYPNDGVEAETLLKNADQAMHVAKDAGRNSFAWFTLDQQLAAQVRRALAADLRQALTAEQFQLLYQPIVDLNSGRIVKAEALIRWQHPSRGTVSPAVFIPLAEELGLISDIGNWVFRTAADQTKRWEEQGKHIQVSVNVSPRQFGADQPATPWLAYLNSIELAPQRIIIEITEGLLLDQRTEVTEQLLAFRAAGMEIAIDDFGTGYSALSYLQRFDVDYLKIDRSFIKDLAEDTDDQALADAIVVMAQKLGLKVVAEGVETPAQRDWLMNNGCDFVQGYLYARPLSVEDFNSLLRSS